ncbi:hypothetical protein ACFL3G_04280 [Planctomycetota bacterium]
MFNNICLAFILLFVFIIGCDEQYQYSIEMKPDGQAIERKIVCSSNFSEEELKRIGQLYEKQVNDNTFQGTFKGKLPKDVGGAGFYDSVVTDMGKTSIYTERFRGNDDLDEEINKMSLKVDQGIDFLTGWLGYELGNDPNFKNLKAFCNNQLKRDCKNIIYYFWLGSLVSEYKSDTEEEFSAHVFHYLFERSYLKPVEIIALENTDSEQMILQIVRRLIAEKMGYPDSDTFAKKMGFLSDADNIEQSFERYIPTTDLYQQLWEAKKQEEDDPNVEPPDTGEVVSELFLDFELWPPVYKVELKLACDSEPFYTNGQWDANTCEVAWSDSIEKNALFPMFFYNYWGSPNSKFQEEHFGRIILSREELVEYCVWRQNLEQDKGKQWDSFLSSLKPGENLKDQVASFRFSEDKQATAEKGRKLLSTALNSSKKVEAQGD